MSYPNPHASYASSTYSPDGLLVSTHDLLSRKVTILSGQNLVRGTVLGKISIGAKTSVSAAVAGNTGNGTITATPAVGAAGKAGVYRLVCIEPATDLGKFTVEDPDGNVIGIATVGTEFTTHVTFTIADGGTDFVAGDSFTITVTAAAGSGKYIKSLSAATDGSQTPDAILAEDVDASSADKEGMAYFRGTFAEGALTLGTAHTAATIREGLRAKGIDIVAVQAA